MVNFKDLGKVKTDLGGLLINFKKAADEIKNINRLTELFGEKFQAATKKTVGIESLFKNNVDSYFVNKMDGRRFNNPSKAREAKAERSEAVKKFGLDSAYAVGDDINEVDIAMGSLKNTLPRLIGELRIFPPIISRVLTHFNVLGDTFETLKKVGGASELIDEFSSEAYKSIIKFGDGTSKFITQLGGSSTIFSSIGAGISTVISGIISALTTMAAAFGITLLPFLAIIAAIAAGAAIARKVLKTMWQVNVGGMQTSANVLGGKWKSGMAKMNVSFIKLARAFDPIIRPLVKFVEVIGGGLIDGLFIVIDVIIKMITFFVSGMNIINGLFEMFFGGLYTIIGKVLDLIGLGGGYGSLGSYLSESGTAKYESGMEGMAGIFKPEEQTTNNNNITFNVGGSNMNEDSYMLFANRILQQIA